MRARPWLLQAAMSFGSTSRALSNSSMATSFDKALEIKPQYNHALEGKGVAMARAGRYEEAVQTFDKAIDIDPVFEPPGTAKAKPYTVLADSKMHCSLLTEPWIWNPTDEAAGSPDQ